MKTWELVIGVGLLILSILYGVWLNVVVEQPRPWDYYIQLMMPIVAAAWLVWRGRALDRLQ